MIVYVLVIFAVFFLSLLELNVKREKVRKTFFFIGAFLITFILAFRGENVGGDMIEYCEYYNGKGGVYGTIDNPSEGFGIGFVFLSYLLRFLLGDSSFVFIFTTSLMTLLPFLYIVWRDSKYKIIPQCLYMTIFFLLPLSQTCIRQNISLFFLFILYIILSGKKGSSKWMFFWVPTMFICAMLCHMTSALTILLGLFIFLVPLNRSTSILLIVCTTCLILAVPNITSIFLDQFFWYFSNIEDAHHFTDYVYNSNMERTSKSISIIVMAIFICTYIYLCSSAQLKDNRIKSFPLKCLVWGTVFTLLFSGFQLGARIVLFFTFLGISIAPLNLTKKKNAPYSFVFVMMMMLYVFSQIRYLAFSKSAVLYDQLVPYNFIFE